MKKYLLLAVLCGVCGVPFAQKKTAGEPAVPCLSDTDADQSPGRYYDHTQPKYPISLGSYSAVEKAAMTKQLVALEKIEEASRRDFQLAGCVARTSFSPLTRTFIGDYSPAAYEYQLALYQYVCHVTEHVVKTVGEYRTVLRVGVNPPLTAVGFYSNTGDFYLTDKSVRYEIPVDATYDKINSGWRVTHPGIRLSQFVSQQLLSRSKEDFDKINTGNGYIEEALQGYDPKKYQWLNRIWYITQPGKPLFLPVTRKSYLEALLEFYEVEKSNFLQAVLWKVQSDSKSTSPEARKRLTTCENDKEVYRKIYEAKKEKVARLLASQSADWLQQPAVVAPTRDLRPNDYSKPSNGLLDFEKFYDGDPKANLLYQFNPDYSGGDNRQPTRPLFLQVQLRYEMGRGFSERFFNNFTKNYDWEKLRSMLK